MNSDYTRYNICNAWFLDILSTCSYIVINKVFLTDIGPGTYFKTSSKGSCQISLPNINLLALISPSFLYTSWLLMMGVHTLNPRL